ncbi:hypothetical protein [Barnesiella intestinihominis]
MLKTIRIEVESANKPYAVVKRSHYSRHYARRHISVALSWSRNRHPR